MNELVRDFVSRALRETGSLPNAERADLYDLAAKILAQQGRDPSAAEAASQVAAHLREAEAAQMTLNHLLS